LRQRRAKHVLAAGMPFGEGIDAAVIRAVSKRSSAAGRASVTTLSMV